MAVKTSWSSGDVLTAADLTDTFAAKLDTSVYNPGLTLITNATFSASSAVSINSAFSATYSNYRFICQLTGSTGANLSMRFRASGVDTSSNYAYSLYGIQFGGSVGMIANSTNSTSVQTALIIGANSATISTDIFNPFASVATEYTVASKASDRACIGAGVNTLTTAFDGLSLFPNAGTISGSYYIYGYSEA